MCDRTVTECILNNFSLTKLYRSLNTADNFRAILLTPTFTTPKYHAVKTTLLSVQHISKQHCYRYSTYQNNTAISTVHIKTTLLSVQYISKQHCYQYSTYQNNTAISTTHIKQHCYQYSTYQNNTSISTTHIKTKLVSVQHISIPETFHNHSFHVTPCKNATSLVHKQNEKSHTHQNCASCHL